MVGRKVKWTAKSINDKLTIYNYWFDKNKSISYCKKLEKLFDNSLTLVAQFPNLGRLTTFKNIRCKPVSHYNIFYKITKSSIIVLSIWDTRRNPENLKL